MARKRRFHPGAGYAPGTLGAIMFGAAPQWALDAGIQPGTKIAYRAYAGRGLRGPEYREATGTVHIVGPDGVVVTRAGDRYGAMPTVVTAETFIRVVSRKRNPPKKRRKKNPALHSAKVVGSNMIEVDHGSVYILYSYETPVAIRPREGVGSKPLATSTVHSRTTSKHIGIWLRSHGYTIKDAVRLPQEEIDAIAKRGYYAKPIANPYGPRAKYRHSRVRAPGRFAPRSFRTIRVGKKRLVVGHLRGEQRRTRTGRTRQTVQAILRPRRRRGTVKRNPTLAMLGNPRGMRLLGDVEKMFYTHGWDHKRYVHHFTPRAKAYLTRDGRVVLKHPSHKLWDLFEM